MLVEQVAMRDRFTATQAFKIMELFINSHYQKAWKLAQLHDLDLGIDLSIFIQSLQTDQNGQIKDVHTRQCWQSALKSVLSGYEDSNEKLTVLQVYYVAKQFLNNYCTKNVTTEVALLLEQLQILDEWMHSVAKVAHQQD